METKLELSVAREQLTRSLVERYTGGEIEEDWNADYRAGLATGLLAMTTISAGLALNTVSACITDALGRIAAEEGNE